MSISLELSRLQASRDAIRDKLIELGIATGTDKLDVLANAISGILNMGAVSATVQEGDTYTIPAGYHNGSGTVSGVKGGGNYSLQSKGPITPTKQQQSITPDSGYFGLSDVTIAAIPDAYQNVSSVTALADEVLTGKVYVTSDGTVTTGTMPNNGAVNKTLDVTSELSITYTIPKGFHNGNGKVTIVIEEKEVTPTKSTQTVTPTAGKVLSKVTVNPIPDKYVDTTDATASAEHILSGKSAYVNGVKLNGAMPDNGSGTNQIYIGHESHTISKGYHSGEGRVYIDPETVTVSPSRDTQEIDPGYCKVIGHVTVNPIPDELQDVSKVDAEAGHVLAGKKIVDSTGAVVNGAMPNNGDVTNTIDGLSATSCDIPAGYTAGGTLSLTGDIEAALAAI